jgi:hypothetical protein
VSLRRFQEWEEPEFPVLRAKAEAVRVKALLAKNARLWGGKSKNKPIPYCTLDFRLSRAITSLEA